MQHQRPKRDENRTMKTSRYLTAALLGSVASVAQAADVVIDTTTSSTFDLNGNSLLVTPSGSISAAPSVSLIGPGATGTSITNEGTLNGSVWLENRSILTGSIINRGIIEGSSDATISILNRVRVDGSIINEGILRTSSSDSQVIGLRQLSTLSGNIINRGLIENIGSASTQSFSGIRINSSATFLGEIYNYGTIRSVNGSGITNTGTISRISNYGTITGAYAGILNNNGSIGTLINAQGSGNSAGPLVYKGVLPTNYNVVINGQTYGQLVGLDITGTTNFGIVTQSVISPGRFTGVLQNIAASNLATGTLSGTYGRQKWFLSDANNDLSWDLFVTADPINTNLALAQTATQTLNAINLQQAALIAILGYDSNVFGPNNVSISAVVRGTGAGGNASEGAGALIAAYRFAPSFRAGLFIDYAPWQNQPNGLQASAIQPTWGGFAVYEQQPDGTGVQARAAIASGRNSVTMTRSALLEGTEAGRGKTSLNGWGAAGELGYGFRLAPQFVAIPFLGIRYTDVTRGSYSEWESTFVASPLTYNALAQQLTTGTAGIRLNASLTSAVSAFVMAGAEYDFARSLDQLSGTSPIEGLETFSVATSTNTNRVRATGAAGLIVQPLPNQKLSAEVAVFQQAYTTNVAVTGLVKYAVGF